MLKLGILCSGNLGLSTLKKITKKYNVQFVLTDKGSKEIIAFSKKNNIPCFAGNPRKGLGFEFVKNYDIDVIASINYLFLVEEDIINHSKILTFNIHGSLLPKYRGRTPHVWAIINGETKAGITAHLIDSGCDTGNIINQIEIPIDTDDTGATMLNKYALEYFPLIERVLNNLESDTLTFKIQDESQATYFGKRTPLDGQINWNWKKEDVRNWVRAQAYPYPGAFSYFEGRKVIIDKVSLSDVKNIKSQANGAILQVLPKVIVKTKNGAVSLDEIRTENCSFVKGKTLENENRK